VDLRASACLEAVAPMPAKRPTRGSKKLKRPTKGASKRATQATKLDLYAKHKNEYVASRMPAFVRVGPAQYLAVRGKSAPGAEQFQRAIAALYNVAFTVKMARKSAGGDYAVTKLEGLWWEPADAQPNAQTVWNWQLMIRVPPFITSKEVHDTIDSLIAKGKSEDLRYVELVPLEEGECVQILHIGPYTEEKESIGKMREFAGRVGRKFRGWHHEIYLSDPRRVKPEKLKTILRNPVS
jgi:hypothetical protein